MNKISKLQMYGNTYPHIFLVKETMDHVLKNVMDSDYFSNFSHKINRYTKAIYLF